MTFKMIFRICKSALLFIVLVGFKTTSGYASEFGDGVFTVIETNKGRIVGRLFYERAPMSVANYIGLVEGKINHNRVDNASFYDGLIFHRVIPNYLIQGGCPDGNGYGDPGYMFDDEFHPELRHDKPGVFSMANSGKDSNGSQFFITHRPTPQLDDKHSVFGEVIDGMNVVYAMQPGDRIEKVSILRVGEAAQAIKVTQSSFDALIAEKREQKLTLKAKYAAEAQKKAFALIRDISGKNNLDFNTTDSGLMYVITQKGEGMTASLGSNVSIHYVGSLLDDGHVFYDSRVYDTPIRFLLDEKSTIDGLVEGLLLMKKGEKRTLIIPPELAYGENGTRSIAPDSFLVFEVELVDVK